MLVSNSLYRIFELKQRTRAVNVPLFWRLRRVFDCVAATIAHPIIDATHCRHTPPGGRKILGKTPSNTPGSR